MRANAPTLRANDRFRVSGGKIEIGYPNRPGRISATPSYVVTIIDAGNLPVQHVIRTVTKILADRAHDLVVRVEMRASEGDRTVRLRDILGRLSRVHIAPPCSALDEFPDAPFHVVLPASVEFAQHLVHRLRTRLGDAVTAVSFLPNGTKVLITRAWAFRRVRRSEACLACFGKVRQISASTLKLRSVDPAGGTIRITSAQTAGWPGTWPQLLDWALDIRSVEEAWAFLKWSVGLVLWGVANRRRRAILYLRRLLWASFSREAGHSHSSCGGPNRTDGETRSAIPLAASQGIVAAFDPRLCNPIGWLRVVGNEVAALGPLALLPPGIQAHRVMPSADLLRLRRVQHVEDVRTFHADVVTRAHTLIRLAAAGVVVHLADERQVPLPAGEYERLASLKKGASTSGASKNLLPRDQIGALVGADLYRLMTTDVSGIDVWTRELLSVRMRRAALRDHSLRAYAPPLVSILVATKRPRFLSWILDAVTRQTYPALELVLALHGGHFVDVDRSIAQLRIPVKTVHMPACEPLGAVLNAATSEANGTFLAKMDDDDLYGSDHVWDMVLAHEYSKASLVGKWSEFVYLASSDQTIHRSSGCNEDYRGNLTGGALLISRRELDRLGGWRRTQRSVDSALIGDFVQTRQSIYRTQGLGYMMVRHGDRHTYNVSDYQFLIEADRICRGWRPEMAGIEEPVPPYPGLDAT